MRIIFETADGKVFESFDDAHSHEVDLFDNWATRPRTVDGLIQSAEPLGYYEGQADEVLTQIFLDIYHLEKAA